MWYLIFILVSIFRVTIFNIQQLTTMCKWLWAFKHDETGITRVWLYVHKPCSWGLVFPPSFFCNSWKTSKMSLSCVNSLYRAVYKHKVVWVVCKLEFQFFLVFFSIRLICKVVLDCYYQLLTTEGGAVGWTVEMVGNWVTGRKFWRTNSSFRNIISSCSRMRSLREMYFRFFRLLYAEQVK